MKNNILYIHRIFCCLLFLYTELIGQQPAHYSLYIFNPLPYNPALTANREWASIGVQYRDQWMGMDGAPKTGQLNIQAPFGGGRNGIALALTADRIGMTGQNSLTASYAYRFKLNETSKIALGLQTSVDQFRIAWEKARPLDVDDTEIPAVAAASVGLNFGLGAHFSSDVFFVGISAPQLLPTPLYSDAFLNDRGPSAVQNKYLMVGGNFALSEKFRCLPSFLLVNNKHQPLKIELGAQFAWDNAVSLGANLRPNDSLDAFLMFKINQHFHAGIAWDFTTSPLRRINSGSFELMLAYFLRKKSIDSSVENSFFRFF